MIRHTTRPEYYFFLFIRFSNQRSFWTIHDIGIHSNCVRHRHYIWPCQAITSLCSFGSHGIAWRYNCTGYQWALGRTLGLQSTLLVSLRMPVMHIFICHVQPTRIPSKLTRRPQSLLQLQGCEIVSWSGGKTAIQSRSSKNIAFAINLSLNVATCGRHQSTCYSVRERLPALLASWIDWLFFGVHIFRKSSWRCGVHEDIKAVSLARLFSCAIGMCLYNGSLDYDWLINYDTGYVSRWVLI